jgi:hypothetical protein
MSTPVKLPFAEEGAFVLNAALERTYRLQWVVDPPYLRFLKEEIRVSLVKEQLKYQADVAQLDAQAAARLAAHMKAIAEIAGR